MAYSSSAMRTSAMRWPATSKRRAVPASISSRRQSRTASPIRTAEEVGVGSVELGGQQVDQVVAQRFERDAVEHVAQEPEHDQAVRHLRRHPARLQVVALLLVDRTDGGGVTARHVVLLD